MRSPAGTASLQLFDIAKLTFVYYDARDREDNHDMDPHVIGKRVLLHAMRTMVMATTRVLEKTGLTWDDIDWLVPHQANLRIDEQVVQYAEIPKDKVLNSIMWYGNTTAATVPLTIDHWRREGKLKKGDVLLSTVFGSGFIWGSAIFQL